MTEEADRIPTRRDFDVVRSHSPELRLSAGRRPLSRLPYGAPKSGAVLTGAPPRENTNLSEKGEWELGLGDEADASGGAKGERSYGHLLTGAAFS
jgi:hypothetical protein